MKRTLVALFVLPLAAIGLAAGCGGRGAGVPEAAQTKGKAAAEEPEDEAVPVEVATIGRGPIEEVLRFSTNLEAEEAVQVVSQAARQVTQLLVEEGDDVARGAVLLRLQDEEQRTELERVRSQLAKAEREYERQQSLFDQQLVSEQAMNDSTYELEQLKLRLQDAERQLSYATVRAPVAGTITQRMVNVGDQVTVNQHLFDMVDFDSIVARVYVPEKAMPRLRVGQEARILATAFGDEPHFGRIDRIAPVVDPRTGTVKVTVAIPRSQALVPGMYVSVELVTEVHEDAILVPKRAAVYDDDQIFVFRVVEGVRPAAAQDGGEPGDDAAAGTEAVTEGTDGEPEEARGPYLTVERLRLRPALESREYLEPADGIEPGDRLVVAGQTGLKDGSEVRLVGDRVSEDSRRRASFLTSRPVAITMVFVAVVVFGWFSYGRLPVTLMPELSYPTLTVRTEYPGAAPEEVENDVSRPIEEALGVVGGLRRISSVSRADVSDVILEFSWDTEMSEAIQDSLEKLDLILLPEEAERPLILRFDPSLDPVLELSLSGRGDRFAGEEGLRRLRRVADLQVKRALEPIKGVAAVRVRGGLEEEIHVLLDEEALARTGLSIQAVIDRLAQENINLAGGTLTEGRTEYMVRTLNEYQDLGQIENTVVASFEGRDVRIRDLGRVERSHKERQILTRTNSGESVQIDLFKEADANIVALAQRVRAALGTFDFDAPAEPRAKPPVRGPGRGPGGGGVRLEPAGLVAQLYKDEGVRLEISADRSLFIQSSIAEVRNTALLGGLLAVLVLFLFLRDLRTTAIVAISIPISLLVTFAPLNLLGISLNIMSLGGLALGVGMLVDSSIVVLESIFRCREEGDSLATAAERGTLEVRGAVVASTLTTIAVFFPMVFVEGVAGQAFGDLGLAVVMSLLASRAVALFLIPMLASRKGRGLAETPREGLRFWPLAVWNLTRHDVRAYFRRSGPASPAGEEAAERGRVGLLRWIGALPFLLYVAVRLVLGTLFEVIGKLILALFFAIVWIGKRFVVPILAFVFGLLMKWPLAAAGALLAWLQESYPSSLRRTLARPLLTLVVVAACFGVATWALSRLDTELLPEVHQGEFTVEVALPVGTPLEETEAVVSPVEEAILSEREHIESLLLTVGYDPSTSNRSDEGEHTARFKVLLDRADPATEEAVIARLRRRFAAIPDVDARVTRPVLFSFKAPIEVEVHGEDLVELRRLAERTVATLAALPELADVETTLRRGAPEVQVVYDRDLLARYDMAPQTVARLVRDEVQGNEATRYNLKDRRIPIVVRLEEEDRRSVEDVRRLIVNPGGAKPIPLSAVADVGLGEGPSEVRRVDGRRVALITANLGEGASLGQAVDRIRDVLDGQEWPSGTTFFLAGQNEEWERSRSSLWLAMALSVFLVYVIMAAQFESLLHPLVILFAIPLAFFGTVLTLLALGISLSIVVFLGMIMLAGIVVNNAIVLVDYVNVLRRRGMEREEAVVTAGSVRLRPILMTTATTVLGLLPMAVGLGDGAELRTPMAIAVISGLVVSTLLTLYVIPVLYSLLEDLKTRLAPAADEETAEGLAPEASPS
ncbi:MAG: efflux RND transporter permease subunit [Thermoanaerobaculia bacterium]